MILDSPLNNKDKVTDDHGQMPESTWFFGMPVAAPEEHLG